MILAQGWGLLRQRAEHKAPGRVQDVPAPYTSLRCSACGWIDKNSRKSQAEFVCSSCGFTCNADENAAINVAAGRGGIPAPGEQPVPEGRHRPHSGRTSVNLNPPGLESPSFKKGRMPILQMRRLRADEHAHHSAPIDLIPLTCNEILRLLISVAVAPFTVRPTGSAGPPDDADARYEHKPGITGKKRHPRRKDHDLRLEYRREARRTRGLCWYAPHSAASDSGDRNRSGHGRHGLTWFGPTVSPASAAGCISCGSDADITAAAFAAAVLRRYWAGVVRDHASGLSDETTLNSGPNERRGRGLFFPVLSILDILAGQKP
ncbi:zinc ribbon domain-containing protein [Streptomyces sp. NPDC054794]